MITPATIRTADSQFSGLTDDEIQMFIDDAMSEVSQEYFGASYKKALRLHTMHHLLLRDHAALGATGAVTSISGNSESYGFSRIGGDSPWSATTYGVQYEQLFRSCYTGGLAV